MCRNNLKGRVTKCQCSIKNNFQTFHIFIYFFSSLVQGDENVQGDEKDTFTDGTIVEFRYEMDRDAGWQWIPIRVRRKKTAEYRAGKNNFGNAYHVANSVWRSIHNPVTETMIRTGANIPSELVEDDVYYNRKSDSTITRALRDFHNLFVKRILILSVANRGDTLIDMTVGKGGDFPKWIAAKLSFVFGMDISRDNIQNRINGACARFLNYRKKWKTMPMALFVSGNSALNIRGQGNLACFTDKGKQITRAVFGEGPKDEAKLGAGVYKQYGKDPNLRSRRFVGYVAGRRSAGI